MDATMSSVCVQLDRFCPVLPAVDLPVNRFNSGEAIRLIQDQSMRMEIEGVAGAEEWCAESDPDRWAEVQRLFWSADDFCLAGDMDGLKSSLDQFWLAWKGINSDFMAARNSASRQLELV